MASMNTNLKKEMEDMVAMALRKAIDHCNGRDSTLSQLIAESTKKRVAQAILEASEIFEVDAKAKAAIMKDAREAYKNTLRHELSEAVRVAARAHAHEMAQEIVKKLVPNLDFSIDTTKMVDPSYGSTPKEALIVEMIAEVE